MMECSGGPTLFREGDAGASSITVGAGGEAVDLKTWVYSVDRHLGTAVFLSILTYLSRHVKIALPGKLHGCYGNSCRLRDSNQAFSDFGVKVDVSSSRRQGLNCDPINRSQHFYVCYVLIARFDRLVSSFSVIRVPNNAVHENNC